MTRSTGTRGLIFFGSAPSRFTAARIEARSTTAGTPVKSWRMTRAGMNGSSTSFGAGAFQAPRFFTSSAVTTSPSTLRRTASSSTLIENGRRASPGATPAFSRMSSRWIAARPKPVSRVERAPNASVFMVFLSAVQP